MSTLTNSFWDADERAALAKPERLLPDEWAAKYRKLSRRQSNRPGYWSDLNQPTLRGFMQLCARRGIREIWVKKYASGGWSEAIRNVIGCRAHLQPCPVQLTLPNRVKGRDIMRKRILPLFEDTPVLAELLTGQRFDKKQDAVTLKNSFELVLAYAGSTTSIAGDPQRMVVLDEVDKFDYRGIQADPVAEARVRTRSFGDNGLVVAISTPSVPTGPVAVGFSACKIKLYYHVPCPHCGAIQRLVRDNLCWDAPTHTAGGDSMSDDDRAAYIRVHKSAWLRCDNPDCEKQNPAGRGRIVEAHKREILIRGYWGTTDGSWKLWFDGREEGGPQDSDRVGIQIGALYDMQEDISSVAGQVVAAGRDPGKLKAVYNVTFGEEFFLEEKAVTAGLFDVKSRSDPTVGRVLLPPKAVPRWASRLVMTIDTQKDHFWYVVRAWGFNYRSARVDHGRVSTFEELAALQYDARWHYEADAFDPLTVHMAGIDTGGGIDDESADATRTDQVYQWCNRDAAFRIPLKGASKSFEQHIAWRDVTYQDPTHKRDPYRVRLHFIDPLYWRDLLDSYIHGTIAAVDRATGESTEVERWSLNAYSDPEYNRHLSNLHKVQLRRGAGYIVRWQPRTTGARHDYDDCERYQLAMAHGPAQCGMLPSPEEIAEQRRRDRQAAAQGGVRTPDGRPFLVNRR